MAKNGVLSVSFNQDQSCFICCMETGIRIYNIDPLVETLHLPSEVTGSIAIGELLFKSNIIALVGGGSQPKFADNTVLIYDDSIKKFILEITCASPVKGVKLRRDKLIVALQKEIHIFSFPHPIRRILTLETRNNPKGLMECASFSSAYKQLLIFPGHKLGSIQLLDLGATETGISSAPVTIPAHENPIACLAMTPNGTKIASASERGTLIRLWCTTSKNLIYLFRRGIDPASLYCLRFSNNSEFLCMSSDKGTAHLFAIEDISLNGRSSFSHIKRALGKTEEPMRCCNNMVIPPEYPFICSYSESQKKLRAVCLDGTMYGGHCLLRGKVQVSEFNNYLDICDDD